jgi:hypothetical protein
MFRWLVLASLSLPLSGCFFSTAEERAAKANAYCVSIQAPPGSQSYTDCRLRVEQMRQNSINAAVMAPR